MFENRRLKFFVPVVLSALLAFSGCAQSGVQNEVGNKESGDKAEKNAYVDRGEQEVVAVNVPFEKTEYSPSISPYNVEKDLSNIENLDQFPNMGQKQKEMLVKNGFFVRPTQQEQLFYIYEHNEYKKVPSFITADSVLQVYHVFYDYSLRTLESDQLLETLEELTGGMLEKSIAFKCSSGDQRVETAMLKNISYFAVAQLLLQKELPGDIPEDARIMAESEYEKIVSQRDFERSSIFPFELDYSQYKPRGHYTRSEELKRYFRAMMWYGQAPFPLYKEGNQRNLEQTLQAILITYATLWEDEEGSEFEKWEKIYAPTSFYVGVSDDLSINDYRGIVFEVFGKDIDIESLSDDSKIDEFFEMAKGLPQPRIQAKYTDVDAPVGIQFRFMGQRYVPDSEIMQRLVEPIERPIPKGLDVMGVLGSERAYNILVNYYNEDEKWSAYPEEFKKLKEQFGSLGEDTWMSNMYYGWMWTLKGFLKEYGEGYPEFMKSSAWTDKSLASALGSWSELKHDTVLYGKQSGAECGGGEEPPQVKGYVEPSIEVYDKLLWLNRYSRANLDERGLLDGKIESKLQQFDELLEFLIECSVKELEGEELDRDEYYQLLTYGGMLEYLTSSFAGDGMKWYEITSETDKNMAVISDVHTIAPNSYSGGGYLEVGVGPAHEIYVVVPMGEKLYITRGAVFSYHEFVSEGERLTDEQWQKMIEDNNHPGQQDWILEYMSDEKLEIPVPATPYSSGC